MTSDDDLTQTDAAEQIDLSELSIADDYPVGMLASPTRIRL